MGSGAEIFNAVINQGGTPAMLSNTIANRPAFGYRGRIFIATDTREIYRDTGTAWELIGSGTFVATNIYNSNGALTGNRTVSLNNFSLVFNDNRDVPVSTTVSNNFAGTQAVAGFTTESNAGTCGIGKSAIQYSGYKILLPRYGYLYSNFGLSLLADQANILFSAGGASIPQMTLTNLGRLLLNTTTDAGFLADFNGTVIVRNTLATGQIIQAFASSQTNVLLSTHTTSTITNTGIYCPGGNAIGFSVAGNRVGYVSSSWQLNEGLIVANNAFPTLNSTAVLEASSTTKGFLQPRLTLTQRNAITSPATGLEIYNSTSNRPNFYDGTAWREITNIYLNDGTLLSNRIVTGGGNFLNFQNVQNFTSDNFSDRNSYATFTELTNTISANVLTAGAGYYSSGVFTRIMNLSGNNTFGTATINAGATSTLTVNFSASGTLTHSQAGLRAFAGHQVFNTFGGTASGTITHFAGMQILGLYNNNTGVITPTITNAYGLAINNLNDYSHTFTLTNRWGVYQTGGSDNNYFAGKLLVGTTTVTARQIHINGNIELTTTLSGTAGGSSGNHLSVWVNGTEYKIALLNA